MVLRLIIFLAINFGALAIGGYFTGKGVPSDWYVNLNKAPWTPPGWAFGFAWSTIMICFSIYLAHLWPNAENKKLLVILFVVQWVLNVCWNPIFFHYHNALLGLVVISILTIAIGYLIWEYRTGMKYRTLLLLPYFIWLLVATSLNGYILAKN